MLLDIFLILGGLAYTCGIIAFRTSIATRAGVVDHPGSQGHKAHEAPTPLVGGIASLPPAILAAVASAFHGGLMADDRSSLLWMAVAVALSAGVGFVDDRKHIPAAIRLLICGLVFSLTLLAHHDFVVDAVNFENLGLRLIINGTAAIIFSTLCLLAFQNSVNMADGRDGLVIGLSIIWCITLLIQGRHPTNLTMIVVLMTLTITMAFNWRGKLFLGDAGTYGLGALIGLVAIWVHRSGIGLTSSQVISMFFIPMLDMIRLFFFRLASRRSPFGADHHHLHHYLDQAFGWNVGRIIYFLVVAIPIVISEANDAWGVIGAGVGLMLYCATILYTRRLSPRVRAQFS